MYLRMKKPLAYVLSFLIVAAFSFGNLGWATKEVSAETELTMQTPAVVVTGKDVIGNEGVYSADNVSKEKSYTLDELKTLDGVTGQMYSGRKSKDPFKKSYSIVDGVKISSLLDNLSTYEGNVSIIADDGYGVVFNKTATYTNDGETKGKPGLDSGRYYYDDFDASKKTEVPAVLSWAYAIEEGINGNPPTIKPTATEDVGKLRLYVGQYDDAAGGPEDMNQPLFNGKEAHGVNKVQEGDAISEVVFTVGSKEYTRADILLMQFAERAYTYLTSNGKVTETVRGVPMSVLLDGADDDATVTFTAADGYDVSATGKTVKELVDNNYMLAYYNVTDDAAIYATAKKDATKYGFFSLYGDGDKPAKMVNSATAVKGIDYSKSPYKHITNGGITGQQGPYNIDAITGATLTVEGPGAETSVPLAVKDLESQNNGCFRGVYTDIRDSKSTKRMYEGVDLYYILHNMQSGTTGIKLTDKANKVVIKNQNRESISTFTLAEVEAAHNAKEPILVSYGTAYEDGTNVKPYVFDYSTGGDKELGNYDGCLKLVYNTTKYGKDNKYDKFSNMAYIYVEEETEPGYKHDKDPYKSAENSQYVLTLTGDKLGYEVNYTVDELENMVEYDEDGNIKDNSLYGFRDEYSLANSTYWYVNEYEGVRLWSLLQRSGMPESAATDDATKDAKVSFKSTDNYGSFDNFTLSQVADPSQFSFYKKNTSDPGDGSYEGDERIRHWDEETKTWVGDKIKSGYPVLVAYGVNKYPYVKSNKMDGYLSGLQNDGGPLRVIWGKQNYKHANGSNQAKLVEKVIVGNDNNHYATHKYSDNSDLKALADNELAVKVTSTTDGGGTKTLTDKKFKIGEIEDIVYDGKLPSSELLEAKVKAHYQGGNRGYSDLYEGVNLNYFLKNKVGLTGTQGNITFTDSSGETLVMDLEKTLNLTNGYNSETGESGLSPILAYGKNGRALVKDSNSDGYVDKMNLAEGTAFANKYTVKNNGGPLYVIFPKENAEATEFKQLQDVVSIEISLETDKYAHVDAPYDTYADNELTVSGEGTRLSSEKAFKLSELEGKQTLLTTADYSFRNSSGTVSQLRYRGLDLNKFLKSTDVGLKSNADKVKITTTDDNTYEFEIGDIQKTYKNTETATEGLPVMLAYGSASVTNESVKDGKPLVGKSTDLGYDSEYQNDGGPLKLIFGQTDATDANKSRCVKDVASIEVTAGESKRWTHDQGVFTQYLTDTFKVVIKDKDGNEKYNHTYTVADLEAMLSLIERVDITSSKTDEYEGLVLYKFIQQECGKAGVDGSALKTVRVTKNRTSEVYGVDILGKVGSDVLKNGVKDGENRVPIILAYGTNGLPLAFGDKKDPNGDGYDSTVGNNCGPIRLMVHNAQGACISEVNELEVVLGENTPEETADFTIKSGTESKGFSVNQLKAAGADEKEYTTKDGKEKVRGVYLKDLLASAGITDEYAVITVNAGGYEAKEPTYQNITLKAATDENYMVAYEVYDPNTVKWESIVDTEKTPNSKVRIYREYLKNHPEADQTKWYNKCQYLTGVTVAVPAAFKTYKADGKTLPMAGLRSTSMDYNKNLWIGTYGGGSALKESGKETFKIYNTASEPALDSSFVSAVAVDKKGGVWMSQNASYTNPNDNRGVVYMKDGKLTKYRATDGKTIPNDYVQAIKIDEKGNVWFGSFGGLTKYSPATGKWQTWDEDDGFPAMSVSTIELDGNGGLWVGFYPDSEAQDGSKPFTGGFAYFKNGEVVKSYKFTSAADSKKTGSYRLGDVWVRDIAVAGDGSAWVVASGSYSGMDNCGGKVWHVAAAGGEATQYDGYDLVGETRLGTTDASELRAVAIDPDGGIWFGSSKDGVIYAASQTVTDGHLDVTTQYSKATDAWDEVNYDNVFSIDFYEKTVYIGSANGLATQKFDFINSADIPEPVKGKITVESASAAAGRTATVKLNLKDNPGILGAKIKVSFDSRLTLKSAENGNALDEEAGLEFTKPGKLETPCNFVWDGEKLEEAKDGTLLVLNFEIPKDAERCAKYDINVSYEEGDICDINLENINLDIEAGSVTAADYTLGDVNDDGKISTKDIIMARRHIAGGYTQEIVPEAIDVNGDGNYDSSDIVLLRRYVAGGYGVEFK